MDRHGYIGASDARRIVENDWLTLYNEKVGLAEPEDLSGVFRVQLGQYTEPFHLDWLERTTGLHIIDRQAELIHPEYPFLLSHIDGRFVGGHIVEVKHSNGRATARDTAYYYMPQLQHIMLTSGEDAVAFSVIAGNDEPERCLVERNDEYIDQLLELERGFWWHVENLVPPEITPTGKQAGLKVIGKSTPIDGLKPYDMTGNNHWAQLAYDYSAHEEAAAIFESAKKKLKELVPDDASECAGHGIVIRRDRRGALRFAS